MRLLTIDIETRPINADLWSLWNQNISLAQIHDPGDLLCFAAKFHNEKKIHFFSEWADGQAVMAKAAYRLFDEADAVVGWNSDKFDIRWLLGKMMQRGMSKPSPFRKVDLLKSVKRQAYLPSYKLDYVAQWLGVGRKVPTGGFELWRGVGRGEDLARAKMRRYNIGDTKLTEAVYDRLASKGWVQGLPNLSVKYADKCCPNCGGKHLQSRGEYQTNSVLYPQVQCRSCFSWLYLVEGKLQTKVKVCA